MQPALFPFPRRAAILLALMSLLLSPCWAAAFSVSARQWELTADRMTRLENPPTIVAEGNVVLEKKEPVATAPRPPASPWDNLLGNDPPKKPEPRADQPATELRTVTTVKADWVSYDLTKGVLTVKGNLLIDIGTDQLSADSGSIDLEKTNGTFVNATVISQQKDVHFEGQVIEKTGALTYHIEDGWVITCKLQPGETPPWSFAAADIEITDGGYAFLKHTTFRIKDVPVFYAPIMVLPAKHTRQTGLLFPSFSFSDRDGFGVETPLFINLSPSTDLTLYPRYLANRGMMAGAEYRYVFDERSKGMLMGNFLDDQLSDPTEVDYFRDSGFTHTNASRYWVRGKADQNIGAWTTRLDVDVASDLDYLREFNSGSTGFTTSQARFLEAFNRGFDDKTNKYRANTMVALRSWQSGTSLLAEAQAVNDISDQIYTANTPSQPWTLPSITYSGLVPIASSTGPDFVWDANYSNFWRDKGVGAQRLDLVPTVTAGIPLTPYLETTVSGGIRNTSYVIDGGGADDWQDNNSENRFLSRVNGEVATALLRDYNVNFGDVSSVSHTLRPFLAYGHTAIADKTILPQFDRIDEIEDENAVYYGVSNFFSIFSERKGREYEREYAFLKAKQGFDLRSEESNTPMTPVIVETGVYPLERMRLKYTTHIDVYGDGAFRHSIDGDYLGSDGDRFSLDYRYDERTEINSVRGTFWHLLPYNFAVGYSLERAIEQSETIEETMRLRFIQPCWSVELSVDTTPGDETYMLTFRLANIGNPLGFELPGM